MKRSPLLAVIIVLISGTAFAQNATPTLSNITALADTILHRLTITYDVSDAENDTLEVFLNVSANGGTYFEQNTTNATGDVGFPVLPGTTKQIRWDYPDSLSAMLSSLQVKLIADDRAELITIPQILTQIDSNRMKQNIQWLEGIRHRTTGATHLQEVRDSLLARFQQAGLDTRIHEFPFNNYTGQNIIGRKASTFNDTRTYIVDGHYDTVDDSPGADDNASSIAGILEILRVIAPLHLNHSVDFIGFDLEEQGLLGSEAFVPNGIQPDEQVAGVINMDMIGYYNNEPNSQEVPAGFELFFPDLYDMLEADSFRANFIISSANFASKPLALLFDSMATRYVPDLVVGTVVEPNGIMIPDFRRSDHVAFWNAGYQALHISDGAETRNPHYHGPTDTAGTLNYTFAYNITKAAAATLLHLAYPQHADVKTASVSGDPASSVLHIDQDDCKIFVTPNPNNGIFKVTALNCGNEKLNVRLMAMDGKIIRTGQMPAGMVLEFAERLEQGYYFVEVDTGKKVFSQKVLVR